MDIFTTRMLDGLPRESRKKAVELDAARQDAWAALRGADAALDEARERHGKARISADYGRYREDGSLRRMTEEEVEALYLPFRRLEVEIEERHAPRHRRAQDAYRGHDGLANVAHWLQEALSSGTRLRHMPLPKHSADPHRVVEDARRRLDEIEGEFRQIEGAPRLLDDARAAVLAEIAAIADRGKLSPDLRIRAGSPIRLTEALKFHPGPSGHFVGDPSAMLIGLLRPQVEQAALSLLPETDLPGALSDEARERAFTRLAVDRLETERREEAALVAAASKGHIIARRADADPRAVLELAE